MIPLSFPTSIVDSIIVKMTFLSFTRMRMTCKQLYTRFEKHRLRFPVRYNIESLYIRPTVESLMNEDNPNFTFQVRFVITNNSSTIALFNLPPSELIGASMKTFYISYLPGFQPWMHQLASIFCSRKIVCEEFRSFNIPHLVLFQIMNCFHIRVRLSEDAYHASLLSNPQIQTFSGSISVNALSHFCCDFPPTTAVILDLFFDSVCDEFILCDLFEKLQIGAVKLNNCQLAFDDQNTNFASMEEVLLRLPIKCPISLFWSIETHHQSALKDYNIEELRCLNKMTKLYKLDFCAEYFYGIFFNHDELALKLYHDMDFFIRDIRNSNYLFP